MGTDWQLLFPTGSNILLDILLVWPRHVRRFLGDHLGGLLGHRTYQKNPKSCLNPCSILPETKKLSMQQWHSKTTQKTENKLLERKQLESQDATHHDHFVHPSRQTYQDGFSTIHGLQYRKWHSKGKGDTETETRKPALCIKGYNTQICLRQREIHMLIPKESIQRKEQIHFTYIPAGHVSHWLLPAWSWYFPEGQGMGSGLPVGQ